jgi:uncharacterized protein (TIGR02266 family)
VNSNDSSKGKSAAIRARLKFPSQQAFIEGYAPNISKTGIFIKTPKPKAVGMRIKFEFQIADGTPVLRGIGEVSWNRAEASAGKPLGMGIKFLKLDAKSRQIVETIQQLKGEEAPVEQDTAKQEVPAQETPLEAAPAEEAAKKEQADKADKAERDATKSRAKPSRRRRVTKSANKKDPAGGIDFGAIDSMLAQISSESDGSPKRVVGRRARRGALKEREAASVAKDPSVPVVGALVRDPEQVVGEETRAETPEREPKSDSGIAVVRGQEPTFEPSMAIKLNQVRELETENAVELDMESATMLNNDVLASETEPELKVESDDEDTEPLDLSSLEKEESEKQTVAVQRILLDDDEEQEGQPESALADDLEEEEETDQFDLTFLDEDDEEEDDDDDDDDIHLIPLSDDDDREEDQSVRVIPVEDEDSEIVDAIASLTEDGIEETSIEDLLEEEDEEETHVAHPDEPVGDFMDDMNDGESVLPPAATEALLQNTEVEAALDDIFQMTPGQDRQPERTDAKPQQTPMDEALDADTDTDSEEDDQALESETTEQVDTNKLEKKKKGFFKKLFG